MNDRIEVLRRSPLFERLSDAELSAVAELCRPRRFGAGETVLREGEPGESLYVLVAGEVDVLRAAPGDRQERIATLRDPEFFGEMSLIDKDHRSATIRTRTECSLLQLSAENFAAFRKASRDGFTFVVINIARVLSARLRDTNAQLAERL
jgi:CRP/FNR family cyclic AMP-dependent transcriptional regulator